MFALWLLVVVWYLVDACILLAAFLGNGNNTAATNAQAMVAIAGAVLPYCFVRTMREFKAKSE